MDIYFVTTSLTNGVEIPTIKTIKPPNLLLSYYYWRTTPLKKLIKKIGYKPKIILDSGAYSAWNSGKQINLDEYLYYIEENKEYINEWITLDVIGDEKKTFEIYFNLVKQGYNPIPVYHYKSNIEYLEKYSKITNRVALGNTVPEKSKSKVATWINRVINKYPTISFHLLGSSSRKIITKCPRLKSLDSSTYVMQAIMGKPKGIEDKVERGILNMKEIMGYNQLPKTEQQFLF